MSARNPLPLVRQIVFGASFFISIIVLALSAHITSLVATLWSGFYYIFGVMGIAVALLTMILIGLMLVSGRINNESVPTKAIFELSCLSILWVLWLATGARAAFTFNMNYAGSCGYFSRHINIRCKETQAIMAFSFLAWIVLMAYTITLLVFAIVASAHGNAKSFTSSVLTTNFLAPSEKQNNENLAPQFNGQTQGSGYLPSQRYPQTQQQSQPGPYPPRALPQEMYPPQGHQQYPSQGYPQPLGVSGSPYSQPGQHPGLPQV
ncbi:hypothetical protein DL96DRAFT_904439 [Flagelloscypha sp. PMI_526]|nr:hypothetical protein DL96DRAFT_904439 [Flagelloscypha sp. PMI_526]